MPSLIRLKRMKKRKCYQENKQKTTAKDILQLQEKRKASYRAYSKACYSTNPERKKAESMARYRADPDKKKAASRANYKANPDKKKAVAKANYRANPEKKKVVSKANYRAHPEKKVVSKVNYRAHPEKKKAASKANYMADPEKKKAAFRRYAKNTPSRCTFKRHSYALAEPKLHLRYTYMKKVQDQLLDDCEATAKLLKAFKIQHATVVKAMPRVMARSAAIIATKRLINKALHLRKQCAGSLLAVIRKIRSQDIAGKQDFGQDWHTTHSEPYFYDSAYHCITRNITVPIDDNGKCIISDINHCDDKTASGGKHDKKKSAKWRCSSECKTIQQSEIDAIVSLKQAFELPMPDLRRALHTCDDGCPNQHYSKPVVCTSFNSDNTSPLYTPKERQGHPLVCFNDGGCNSKLRILRSAATHYPILRIFLGNLYHAIRSHSTIYNIDAALNMGDFLSLMEILKIDDFETLLGNNVTSADTKELHDNVTSALQDPDLESNLIIDHSQLISNLKRRLMIIPSMHVVVVSACIKGSQ